jgi:hypothetical protein
MQASVPNTDVARRAYATLQEAMFYLLELEKRIGKPFAIIDENHIRGFRFAKPGIVHYVVINVSRSLSILNGMILLCNNGFNGEMAILARALLENASKLSFVVGGLSVKGMEDEIIEFIGNYFGDTELGIEKRTRYRPTRQKDIHRRNSEKVSRDIKFLNKIGLSVGVKNDGDLHQALESNLYNIFSNHVHGRYPEMMGIYGEWSTELKLNGNLESKDIDAPYEQEMLENLADRIADGFRIALLHLEIAKLITLSDSERVYCFEKGI